MRIFLMLFIILLSYKYVFNTCNDDESDSNDPNASSSSCKQRTLSEKEMSNDGYKCCYAKYKCNDILGDSFEVKECQVVSKYEYDNIEKAIDAIKLLGCKDVSVQCKSSYLDLALIYFILLLL